MIEKPELSLQNLSLEDEAKDDIELATELARPGLMGVEELIGYNFANKDLLEQALTDKSYKDGCPTYERLEYLGDAVLGSLIAIYHYNLYPDSNPGQLTRLRSANVDTEKLARAALKLNLQDYFRHKKPLFKEQIQEFKNEVPKYALHSYGQINPPKVLADIVESIIGSVFDDSKSYDTTWKVIKTILEPMITFETLQLNPISKLREYCQKRRLDIEEKDLWPETGTFEYHIGNKLTGRGVYKGKKETAMQRAAEDAYNNLLKLDQLFGYNNSNSH